jgi:hypothetical protein
VVKWASSGKPALIGAGLAILLALVAVVGCALVVGLGIWVSRASLAQVSPAITPSVPPPPTPVTPGAAQPPESGVQSGSSAPIDNPLPDDIPMPENVDPQSFVGGANQASFLADLPYEDVRDFYQVKCIELGWSLIPFGTRIGQSSAELHYRKDNRTLTVRIVDLPFVGLLIEINLQA